LQQYLRRQQADQNRTIEFSDRLPGLFMHSDPLLGLARTWRCQGSTSCRRSSANLCAMRQEWRR
jgi:hypothetical protein